MFWMWNRMVLVSNFNQLSSPIFSSCLSCSLNCRFLFGFLCPPMWFYATILYFGNHYRKDPRERAGLGASAIAVISLLFLFARLVYIFLSTAYVRSWNDMLWHESQLVHLNFYKSSIPSNFFKSWGDKLILTYKRNSIHFNLIQAELGIKYWPLLKRILFDSRFYFMHNLVYIWKCMHEQTDTHR